MRIELKRAASLAGHDYQAGKHEVPDSVASHWFFLALVANGKAVVLEAAKAAAPVVEPAPIVPVLPVSEVASELPCEVACPDAPVEGAHTITEEFGEPAHEDDSEDHSDDEHEEDHDGEEDHEEVAEAAPEGHAPKAHPAKRVKKKKRKHK